MIHHVLGSGKMNECSQNESKICNFQTNCVVICENVIKIHVINFLIIIFSKTNSDYGHGLVSGNGAY